METDKELYIVEKEFPNSFVKLGGVDFSGDYEMHSVSLKELSTTFDGVCISNNPSDPLIIIENQGYDLEDFFLRFNQSVSIYCYQNKWFGKIIKVALFLNESNYKKAIKPKHNNDFKVYILSSTKREDLESFNDPALMCLLPLCDVTEQEIVNYYNDWQDELASKLPLEKQQLLKSIFSYFFGEIFDKSIDELSNFLGGDIMSSRLAQEIEQRGIEKGILEGIKKGKIEGIKKGKIEGIKKGKIEGIKKGISALKELYKEGLITKEVYEKKVKELKAELKKIDD